jgi:hypothetical protein
LPAWRTYQLARTDSRVSIVTFRLTRRRGPHARASWCSPEPARAPMHAPSKIDNRRDVDVDRRLRLLASPVTRVTWFSRNIHRHAHTGSLLSPDAPWTTSAKLRRTMPSPLADDHDALFGAHAGADDSAATTSPPPRAGRQPAPAILRSRLSGPLVSLLACGVARLDDDDPGFITLMLSQDEATQGGMATISMQVELWCPDCTAHERSARCARCGGTRAVSELFSAWLAMPPGVTAGEVLAPSVELPGMIAPVRFRVRLHGTGRSARS